MKRKCLRAVLAQRTERLVEDSEKKVCWSGLGAALQKLIVSNDGCRLLFDRVINPMSASVWAKKSGTAKS